MFAFFNKNVNWSLAWLNSAYSVLSFNSVMNRLVIIFCLIFFFQVGNAQSAYECYTIVDGFQSNPFIDEGNEVYISMDKLLINDEELPIKTRSKFFKDYRENVATFFNCLHEFEGLPHHGDIKVIEYLIEDGAIVYFIREDLLEKYYLVYEGFAYELNHCLSAHSDICIDEYYYNPTFIKVQDSFRITMDTTSILIQEAQFETVTEQVLIKDAFNIINVQDPKFDTINQIILIEQQVTCPNTAAIFETFIESIKVIDAHDIQIPFPPTFEIFTEQYQVKAAYSGLDTLSLDVEFGEHELVIKEAYKNWKWKLIDSSLIKDSPNSCLFFETEAFDKESIFKNSLIYTNSCPEGYDQEGNLCYEVELVPAEYQTRSLLLLNEPAYTMQRIFDAQYHKYEKTIISNIDDIDSSCIEEIFDTVQYLKLKLPSVVNSLSFDAKYGTIERQILTDNLRISINPKLGQYQHYERWEKTNAHTVRLKTALCDPFLTETMKEKIINRMNSMSLIDNDVVFGSSLFWDAVCLYQLNHNLPLGNIEENFIRKLGFE